MKTRNLIAVAILLLTGSLAADLSAQETLKALVKKCENMENVNISVVRNKNKETREMQRAIINISFNNNQALAGEFIAAFEKDKEMADQEIENKSNGKTTTIFYRFGNVTYSFSQGNDGSASISVIEKYEKEEMKTVN
ncbi:MAG: DUF5024 domain-containing protein [Tannerellaceae bacterium]|jgi:hypothetical protein|nr:DUF5024 domain-containing protein [Tannerellaceae bacterium]